MGSELLFRDRVKVIDTDTHLSEPHDLWLRRAPKRLRERVPQVKLHNGVMSWVIDGDKTIGKGANASSQIWKDGTKIKGLDFRNWSISDVYPASFDATARVQMMDENGIWAQIVYPNILGFGGQRSAKVDPELRLACVQIYNDAMAEMQEESGQRIFPMALLPWWNVQEAVAECERAARLGLRGININSDPQAHRDGNGDLLPDLGKAYWDPLWEACNALNMPVNFHIGGSEPTMEWSSEQGWPSLTPELNIALTGSMLFFNNSRVVANIIYSGILDRHPNLKFVSVESGIGWIPFLLESLDYQYQEAIGGGALKRKPSEYFRTNFYGTFWFERANLAHSIRAAGIDNVMFETDFPHPACLYPLSKTAFDIPGLTAEEKLKVLCTNAARVYNIPVG